MNINVSTIKLKIDNLANSDTVLVTDICEQKLFVNGKPSDTITGYKCNVICHHNKYQGFSVKLANKPSINQSDIDANDGALEVEFKNFEAKIFQNKQDKMIYISAKADDIIPVSFK